MKLKIFTTGQPEALRVASDLADSVSSSEPDARIIENMIGDIPWSMMNFLLKGERFNQNGFVTACYTDQDEFAGICACEINDLAFPQAVNFGIRLWVHPQYRHVRISSFIIKPQLDWAKAEKKIAWTSFNYYRSAMTRMIQQRANDPNPEVAELWKEFKVLPEKLIINSTLQTVVFKDFGHLFK